MHQHCVFETECGTNTQRVTLKREQSCFHVITSFINTKYFICPVQLSCCSKLQQVKTRSLWHTGEKTVQYIWDTLLLVFFFSSWTPQEQFCDTIGQFVSKEFHSRHDDVSPKACKTFWNRQRRTYQSAKCQGQKWNSSQGWIPLIWNIYLTISMWADVYYYYGYYVQTVANKHFSTDSRVIQQVTPSQIFWHVQRRKFTIFLLAAHSCNSNNLNTAQQHKSQNSCTENEITFFSNCIREPAGSCWGFSRLRRENALFWHLLFKLVTADQFPHKPTYHRSAQRNDHKETNPVHFKKQVCKYHMEII